MFARIRQTILLYVLLIIAATTWFTQNRSRSWQNTLWVDVYPINGDGSDRVEHHIGELGDDDFRAIEKFIESQAESYGVAIERPLRINLGPKIHTPPPPLEKQASYVDAVWWSIKTRWWSTQVTWDMDRPTPDIRMFAVYYDGQQTDTLDRSAALQKGLVAIAHLFADQRMSGSNRVVPRSLTETLVGPATALEIGWQKDP